MKKNYLFILLFFIYFSIAKSQTISISPEDSLYNSFNTTNVASNDLDVNAYAVNLSADTTTIKWRVIEIDANTPSSWILALCDNLQCPQLYEGLVVESGPIAPGDSSILEFRIAAPLTESGATGVKVRVFPTANPTEIYDIVYKADVDVTISSIKPIDTKSLALFPNPTSSFIQIKGIDNTKGLISAEIYSIIGKKIMEKPIASIQDLKVDVSNFENGIYLVKLFDKNKEVVYTKTFVKN